MDGDEVNRSAASANLQNAKKAGVSPTGVSTILLTTSLVISRHMYHDIR